VFAAFREIAKLRCQLEVRKHENRIPKSRSVEPSASNTRPIKRGICVSHTFHSMIPSSPKLLCSHCPSIEGAVNCRGEGKLLAPSTPSTAHVACIRKVRALGPHHCSSRSGVQQLPSSPRSTCSAGVLVTRSRENPFERGGRCVGPHVFTRTHGIAPPPRHAVAHTAVSTNMYTFTHHRRMQGLARWQIQPAPRHTVRQPPQPSQRPTPHRHAQARSHQRRP
jgi:hypothetical protein